MLTLLAAYLAGLIAWAMISGIMVVESRDDLDCPYLVEARRQRGVRQLRHWSRLALATPLWPLLVTGGLFYYSYRGLRFVIETAFSHDPPKPSPEMEEAKRELEREGL